MATAAATTRKAACLLVVWALVVVAGGLGSVSARAPLGRKPQREFDYFALSLQWPGTICASTRHCCASNGCCRYVLRAAALTPLAAVPLPHPQSKNNPTLPPVD